MAQKLQVLPASTRADGGGTSKITDAWLYWREAGVETLLRIDNQGNVLRHSSGPRDLADSYRDIIVVDEGTEVEATHSIDPKPVSFEDMATLFERFTLKQTLSASLAGIQRINIPKDGGKVVVKALPKATLLMKEVFAFDSREVMLVPNVPLAVDPAADDINGHARKFGQQWKDKDPSTRELVLVKPGKSIADFTKAMEAAAKLAKRRTIILNVGHGSDDSASRRTSFFDMTPRTNNKKGASVEATGAMFQDDAARGEGESRDDRVVAFEQAGKAFDDNDVRLFVVLACRVGGPGADTLMKEVSFFLRSDVMGYERKVVSQGVTDEAFVMRSATVLDIDIETSGPVPTGLPPKDRRFTEIPSKFKKTVLRQTERPSRD